jgi:GNAT superfamily N-acetyltransferase
MPDASHAIVRQAQMEDLPRLLVLMHQLSANGARPESRVEPATPEHLDALNELIADPRCHLLVLEDGGEVRGTCVVYILPNLSHRAARWGVVENVVVEEAFRSHGYGEQLMAEAERLAREAGCYRLSLMSNARRLDAHRFYERIGFDPSHQGFTKYFV